MLIASNAQIRDTLVLLLRRPQMVINGVYDKLREAETNGVPLGSVLTEDDIASFQEAMKTSVVFNRAMQKYSE